MRLLSLLVLAAVTALAAPAMAQPRTSAAPQFGTLAATAAGASLDIKAGGPDRNSVPGSGCSGYIQNATPTAQVTASGGGTLSIYVASSTDTTLLISDPSGRWQCSDDAHGSNPAVTFTQAPAGTYTVWVGSFSPEAAGASARLMAKLGPPSW